MGIHVCDNGEGVAFLYESCSGRPINTEAFDSAERAEACVELAQRRGVKLALADAATLDDLQAAARALPACDGCGELVVFPGENRPTQCEDCADDEAYDAHVACEEG